MLLFELGSSNSLDGRENLLVHCSGNQIFDYKIETQNDFLSPQGNTYKNEALSALVVLGIDKKKASNTIDEILKNSEISSVEELIKKTLKAV